MVAGSNLSTEEKHQLLLQTDAADTIAMNGQKSPEGLQALEVLERIHDEFERLEIEQQQQQKGPRSTGKAVTQPGATAGMDIIAAAGVAGLGPPSGAQQSSAAQPGPVPQRFP